MRRTVMWIALVLGLLLFDWWLALPWLVPDDHVLDRLMSDATASGAPNALTIQLLEMAGAVLLFVALLLRGPRDEHGMVRPDWWCAIVLVAFEFVDAIFVEACPSGTDTACFDRELRLELPWHHYLHIAGGFVEWGAAILLAWFGWRRLRGSTRGSVFGWLLVYAAIIVGPLAASFVTHRLFTVVEVTVYSAFSIVLFMTVTERGPARR